MEATTSGVKTSKKDYKKVYKRREDRISSLTNDILVRILSLVPTKYAVRTSVLSTRWKSLWASVPILDFANHNDRSIKKNNFMNFVDRVLLLHSLPTLYKFSLSCWMHDPSRTNTWISTILKRNVQELDLCIDPLTLPRSLFLSDTLTILKIDSSPHPCSSGSVTKIPTSVCLPNLKVLFLSSLKLSTHQSNQRVSFSFPMLQKFELYCCEWTEIESVEIVAPSLESLIFHDYVGQYNGQEIKIYAESLKSLELISELANYLIPCNLNSLAMASIYVSDYLDTDHPYMTSIFREISKVNHLIISNFPVKFISQAEYQPHLLDFSSLIHFKVDLEQDRYFNEEDLCTISSKQLIDILCLLPSVKYFEFLNDYSECALLDSIDAPHKVVPQGSLTNLKLVELKNFHGSKNELVFVRDLLNNAKTLNEMSITGLSSSKKHMKIAKKLQMLPRESNCVIRFS